jgi:hypothetical protein
LFHVDRDRRIPSFVVVLALFLAACASSVPTPSPASPSHAATSPSVSQAPPSEPAPSGVLPSVTPTANTTGFAFAAEDIAAYYESRGYACTVPQPSAKAAGFMFRTCEQLDDAGRTRVVGLVTDPSGGMANAFASVKGKDGETILAPIDVLEPLSGFLGATLGELQGTSLLTWLASHLGDTYAETMSDSIKVATYTESETDHSTLYVEVANRAYLDAPPTAAP